MRCGGFSGAQKIIKAKIGPRGAGPGDPRQLFTNADNFRLQSQLPGDVRFGQSVVVLAAFASELFIKCIVTLESGRQPAGHDLAALFSKISRAVRTKIEKRWDIEFAPKRAEQLDAVEKDLGIKIPRDFNSLLRVGAKSFAQMRYAHEQQPAGNFFLVDFPLLLRATIIDMKPGLA